MNTSKTYVRFWATMVERYGSRWTRDYGDAPTRAWTEILDRFTPDDIRLALDGLGTLPNPEFPPTLPQFESLLRQTQAKRLKGTERNYLRDHWRSQIVAAATAEMVRLERIPSRSAFEDFLVTHRLSLGRELRDLLDELCEMERTTGQRTEGIHDLCAQRVRAICIAFDAIRRAA